MAMKMATVEILIEKARFEPQTALAVAEAIDEAIERKTETTRPVTEPVLDAKMAKIDARFAELQADFIAHISNVRSQLLHHIYGLFVTQMTLQLGVVYFLLNHAK